MRASSNPNLSGSESLEKIVAPLSTGDFLDRYWSKSFIHIPGNQSKFVGLLSWARLNEILAYHQFPPENLILIKNGAHVPAEQYLQLNSLPRWLNAAEITNTLGDGATLILDHVDSLDPNVRKFAVNLERAFRTSVWINMYAGWGTEAGFDLHWDNHHTMILQVSGRKRWKVYKPTRLYPLKNDVEVARRPTEPPIWEGVLEQGGFLHIPRGWWHVAYPMGEPCMHLSVVVSDVSCTDLVRWLGNQLKTLEIARRGIPHLAKRDQRSSYLAEIWQAIQDEWTPDIIERYLSHLESAEPRRPEFNLPFAPAENQQMLESDSIVKLATPFRLDLSGAPQGGVIWFKTFGKTWRCPEVVIPALRALNDGESHRVDELRGYAGDESGSFEIQSFLCALVLEGAVVRQERGSE